MSGVGYETNPELIKEFDLQVLFRRYRIVFWRCSGDRSGGVLAVFWRGFRRAFWRGF